MSSKNYRCPVCHDTGWTEHWDGNGTMFMMRCSCWASREARKLMERSGIPRDFLDKSLDGFDTREIPQLVNAKKKAAAYLNSFAKQEKMRRNSLLLCGQSGAGKTHLGVAVCNGLMDRNIAVSYMAYRNAVTVIKQSMTDGEAYAKSLRPFLQARVLYIDDLLKGRVTESDINILYEIVNYRYMNNLPMVISTEKSIEGLLEFDEAIASRMIEMSRGNIVRLQGKELNYRLFS